LVKLANAEEIVKLPPLKPALIVPALISPPAPLPLENPSSKVALSPV
jgi:hypothetical protein